MKTFFTILIADRNPHVRQLLERELVSEGFRVRLAESAREVLKWVYYADSLDLIILDPELFDLDRTTLLKRLQARNPSLPVVIHGFQSDDESYPADCGNTIFIEKREDSVEHLKHIANQILKLSCWPARVLR